MVWHFSSPGVPYGAPLGVLGSPWPAESTGRPPSSWLPPGSRILGALHSLDAASGSGLALGSGWLWLASFLGFRLDFLILGLAWIWLGFGLRLLAFIY